MSMLINSYASAAAISYTKLLMGFEGADASTTMIDESASAKGTAGVNAQAQIDTAQFKFGSSSLLLDGTSDSLYYAPHADWGFGAGDFTIEAWVRFSNLTGFQSIAATWYTGISGYLGWLFDFPGSANNVLRFGYSTNGTDQNFIQGAWTPSANTWYHVAVDRSGADLRCYANGSTIVSSNIGSATFNNPANYLVIGAFDTGSTPGNCFKGWMDELRITKGLARYASASGYTIPPSAFPRD